MLDRDWWHQKCAHAAPGCSWLSVRANTPDCASSDVAAAHLDAYCGRELLALATDAEFNLLRADGEGMHPMHQSIAQLRPSAATAADTTSVPAVPLLLGSLIP